VSHAHLTVVKLALFESDMFEMAMSFQSSVKCEVHPVIGFLKAKGKRPAQIHKQVFAVYGDIMNQQNMTKWCHEFSERRTDVHAKGAVGHL
jgi:hypothetical protein